MPFMKGLSPIRYTLNYLKAGKIIFKEGIQIFAINYNIEGDHHKGAREFVFWYFPQIQYKNPNVQLVTLKNMTPSPFIRCFWDDGRHMLIDIDNKDKDDIFDHVKKVLGKSEDILQAETVAKEKKDNPANFGYGCEKPCICQMPGQIPCPGVVPLPNHMRGKYIFAKS